MTDDLLLLEQLAAADAYAPDTPLPAEAWTRDVALAEIERRVGMQTDDRIQQRTPQPRPRGWLVAAAAFVAVLIVGTSMLFWLPRGGGREVVDEPTTTATPTTVAPTTTAVATTAAPMTTVTPSTTTTSVAPVVQEPMTWSRHSMGDEGTVAAVIAGGPGFLAGGSSDGVAAIWTSADGTTWQRLPHNDAVFGGTDRIVDMAIFDMAATEDGYVAVGGGRRSIVVWTSTDGIAWDRAIIDDTGLADGEFISLNALAAGPSGLVAVGWTALTNDPWNLLDYFVFHSSDGVVWERADTSDLPPGSMWDVVAGGPGYVAVGVDWSGDDALGAWTSPEGLTWTPVDPAAMEPRPGTTSDEIYHMESITVSDDGRLYAFGNGSAASAWTSTDGATWTWLSSYVGEPEEEFASAWGGVPPGVVVSGDRIVIVGALEYRGSSAPDRAAAWASDDAGKSWTRMAEPGDVFGGEEGWMAMDDLVEVDGIYVAVGAWNGEPTAWVGAWNAED